MLNKEFCQNLEAHDAITAGAQMSERGVPLLACMRGLAETTRGTAGDLVGLRETTLGTPGDLADLRKTTRGTADDLHGLRRDHAWHPR